MFWHIRGMGCMCTPLCRLHWRYHRNWYPDSTTERKYICDRHHRRSFPNNCRLLRHIQRCEDRYIFEIQHRNDIRFYSLHFRGNHINCRKYRGICRSLTRMDLSLTTLLPVASKLTSSSSRIKLEVISSFCRTAV